MYVVNLLPTNLKIRIDSRQVLYCIQIVSKMPQDSVSIDYLYTPFYNYGRYSRENETGCRVLYHSLGHPVRVAEISSNRGFDVRLRQGKSEPFRAPPPKTSLVSLSAEKCPQSSRALLLCEERFLLCFLSPSRCHPHYRLRCLTYLRE